MALVYYFFDPHGITDDPHLSTVITTTLVVVLISIVLFGAATKPLLQYLMGPADAQGGAHGHAAGALRGGARVAGWPGGQGGQHVRRGGSEGGWGCEQGWRAGLHPGPELLACVAVSSLRAHLLQNNRRQARRLVVLRGATTAARMLRSQRTTVPAGGGHTAD